MKKLLIALSIILVCLAALIACEPFSFDKPHQSDHALMQNFDDYAFQFVELVKMSNEDEKAIRIAQDFIWLKDNWNWPRPEEQWGISGMRWDQYRRLFRQLGLTGGLDRIDDQGGTVIHLTAFSMGIVNRGISKGYAFSESALSPLVDSLDRRADELKGGKEDGVVYRRIRGNWYLFFEW